MSWARSRPKPRGVVYASRVGVHLAAEPDTVIVSDVVYAPPELVARQPVDRPEFVVGVPTLTVAIRSPNDTVEQVEEKTDIYLSAGVPLVWVVNPDRRTVTIHRPGEPPVMVNVTHRIPEHPAMPGFTPAVAELFE